MIQLDKFLAGHYEEGYGYKYFVPNLIMMLGNGKIL